MTIDYDYDEGNLFISGFAATYLNMTFAFVGSDTKTFNQFVV